MTPIGESDHLGIAGIAVIAGIEKQMSPQICADGTDQKSTGMGDIAEIAVNGRP